MHHQVPVHVEEMARHPLAGVIRDMHADMSGGEKFLVTLFSQKTGKPVADIVPTSLVKEYDREAAPLPVECISCDYEKMNLGKVFSHGDIILLRDEFNPAVGAFVCRPALKIREQIDMLHEPAPIESVPQQREDEPESVINMVNNGVRETEMPLTPVAA